MLSFNKFYYLGITELKLSTLIQTLRKQAASKGTDAEWSPESYRGAKYPTREGECPPGRLSGHRGG